MQNRYTCSDLQGYIRAAQAGGISQIEHFQLMLDGKPFYHSGLWHFLIDRRFTASLAAMV
jgi:hypothetical protein